MMHEVDLVTEVLNRLETLTKQYDLTKNVYTSYQYDRAVLVSTEFDLDLIKVKGMADIDTIRVKGIKVRIFVEDFERKHRNCRVYHIIETENCLNLLYISGNKNKWGEERPKDNTIKVFVINIDTMKEEGFQLIRIGSKENVLERID